MFHPSKYSCGIVQQYVWDIDQEDKEELIETALEHFSDRETFYQASGLGKTALSQHLNAESGALDLEIASNLVSIVNSSEPRYGLEDPEEFIEQKKEHAGETRVKLEDEFQEYLFQPYNSTDIMEMTGVSRGSAQAFRQNRYETVPEHVYLEVFKDAAETYERLQEDFSASGEIHPKDLYVNMHTDNSALIEVGTEHITEIDSLNGSLEGLKPKDIIKAKISTVVEDLSPQKEGFFRAYGKEAFENIEKTLDNPHKSSLETEKGLGHVYTVLEETGLLEKSSGSSTYRVDADEEYFELFRRELERSNVSKAEDLIEVIRSEAEDTESSLALENLTDNDSLTPEALRSQYKGWRNAVWHAGFEPRHKEYDGDIVIDLLLQKEYELSGRPGIEDMLEDSSMPSPDVVKDHLEAETFDEALEKAGIKYDRNSLREEVQDKSYIGRWFVQAVPPTEERGSMISEKT